MARTLLPILTTLLFLTPTLGVFSLSAIDKNGVAFNLDECYVHTLINFYFSSNTLSSGCGSSTSCTLTNKDQSTFQYMVSPDYYLNMTLQAYEWNSNAATTGYVTGYSSVPSGVSINAAAVFQFQATGVSTIAYVYIPFTTTGSTVNPDVVDLTSNKISNSLSAFDGVGALSAFNFFNQVDYNQWYVQTQGNNIVLVSRYVYKITSTNSANGNSAAPSSTLTSLTFTSTSTTGQKVCYASSVIGMFESSLRQIVAFWFIWVFIFIYWLIYLFSDVTTKSCFNRDLFSENLWTCWSIYSIFKVSHEQFFTKLSRMTVVLTQLTIQGLIIAAIISKQYSTGTGVFAWSAAIAWASTIVLPFLWGQLFHRKIYQKFRHKYGAMKKIAEGRQKNRDKEELRPFEEQIDVCDQKIYGYFHWFYSVVFFLFCVCWPVTIHFMQTIPGANYTMNWYWLAGLALCFFIETFIYEPILIGCLGNRQAVRNRGGYFYDIRLGEMYDEVHDD